MYWREGSRKYKEAQSEFNSNMRCIEAIQETHTIQQHDNLTVTWDVLKHEKLFLM